MDKIPESVYRHFGHSITRKLLFFFFMVWFTPLFALAIYLTLKFPESRVVNIFGGVSVLGALLFSWYFSDQTATFMIRDNLGFKIAFQHVLFPFLSIASFLPFSDEIARWKEKNSYKNPYTQSEAEKASDDSG